jgi:hypothetical protein
MQTNLALFLFVFPCRYAHAEYACICVYVCMYIHSDPYFYVSLDGSIYLIISVYKHM